MKWNRKTNPVSSNISYGFTFEKTPADNEIYRGTICMLKGVLVFCATFGTIGGLLDAFSVYYNTAALFFVLLLLCLSLSFLHYNRVIFNICYPVIFVFFTVTIFRNRILANSGFQSFVSILYEEYSSHFELTSVREANIANTNQYLTVTVAFLFVGFVLALLLNIVISTHMSVLGTILLTAPILQVGIYIEKYPSSIYFVPLIFSYIAIGVLGRFKHHMIPQKKQERFEYRMARKGNKNYHIYQTNGRVLLQTTILFAVASLLFLFMFYPVALKSTNQSQAINNVKKTTDEYVKIYVQNGLSGFFNHYESTGGMSNGRLGGVSSVRPDFETDLVVTFAPYSYETVYLKGFVGIDYTGNSWTSSRQTVTSIPDFYDADHKTDSYMDFTTFMEADRLEQYMHSNGQYALKGRMQIKNVDANPGYVYLPYYTTRESIPGLSMDNHVITGEFPLGDTATYEFYPAVSQIKELTYPSQDIYANTFSATSDEASYLAAYRDYCYSTYTYVPENLITPIKKVVEKTGFGSGTAEKVQLVEQYFVEHYTYSMSPGTTPRNEDFIGYFLTSQNQGYCAHFASAATMILRYMGVPARYVEGYVISAYSISNAEATGEDYKEYMTGTSPIGKTGVITAEITDANAHAWVEVYSDGFGWVPVDVTPPSSEDESNTADFWNVFSNLFSVSPATFQSNTAAVDTPENLAEDPLDAFFASTNHVGLPLLLLFVLLLLFYPLRHMAEKTIRYLGMRKAYGKGQYHIVASYYYRKLFYLLHKKDKVAQKNFAKITPDKVTFPSPLSFEKEDYVQLLEKAFYAENGIIKEEIDQLIQWTKEVVKLIKEKKKRR